MNNISYALFDTAIGPCAVAWRETSPDEPVIVHMQLPEASPDETEARTAERTRGTRTDALPPSIARLVDDLRKHLDGDVHDFRPVPVELSGVASFAKEVYAEARAIPAGRTRTYGEVADSLGRPKAARAVGNALGRNPIPLIIPCHRVLAANGKPGGFSAHGGAMLKSQLLAIEGASYKALDGAAG
ncbi:MAG: methylated-DNA--[protein]-cysteine S-methyltransferase [Capsulimonadaceae bacterium]